MWRSSEGCKVRAVRLAVFDVLDLRLVGDERGGDVGIVDRAADRRVRDLVANAAAGLEAVGKAAAPQVRLVEVDAAAVLHDVAADGGDVSDLRGHPSATPPARSPMVSGSVVNTFSSAIRSGEGGLPEQLK